MLLGSSGRVRVRSGSVAGARRAASGWSAAAAAGRAAVARECWRDALVREGGDSGGAAGAGGGRGAPHRPGL